MKEVLLRGRCEGGLYTISVVPPLAKKALSTAKIMKNQLHCYLGHVSPQVIQHFLSHNNISSVSVHSKTICDACWQAKSH